MPISSKHLRANQRTVTEDYGDDGTLTITWRPGELTIDEEAKLQTALGNSRLLAGISQMLLKCVISWDLTDGDGVTIPLTVDGLRPLEGSVITEVWRILRADRDGGAPGEGARPSDGG